MIWFNENNDESTYHLLDALFINIICKLLVEWERPEVPNAIIIKKY